MASRPETIQKMKKAREFKKQGLSIEKIATKMHLSESRVRELIDGHNWYSKSGEKVPIK